MSKPAAKPKVNQGSALAFAKAIRTSPRKLNLVAQLIRGKNVANALNELTFCRRRIAVAVKKVLQSAIANAENNHGLDVDRLEVAEATVGRAFVMKRFHARGRGKSASIEKPFSNLRVVVREREEEEIKKSPRSGGRKSSAAKGANRKAAATQAKTVEKETA